MVLVASPIRGFGPQFVAFDERIRASVVRLPVLDTVVGPRRGPPECQADARLLQQGPEVEIPLHVAMRPRQIERRPPHRTSCGPEQTLARAHEALWCILLAERSMS